MEAVPERSCCVFCSLKNISDWHTGCGSIPKGVGVVVLGQQKQRDHISKSQLGEHEVTQEVAQ